MTSVLSSNPEKIANARPKGAKARPTLKEVAARSRVAISTVSDILNDRSRCYASQQTQRRVRDAAEALGYRPNLAARALLGKATNTIGMVAIGLDVEVMIEKYMAFEALARKNGYLCILAPNPDSPVIEDQIINWMQERMIDGLVVYPSERGDHHALRNLVEQQVPLVTIDGVGHLGFPTWDVSGDYRYGGELQARHVLEQGRRRVGLLCPRAFRDYQTLEQRVRGVKEAVADVPRSQLELLEIEETSAHRGNMALVYEQVHALLAQRAGQFDAVIAINDQLALLAMRALLSLGARVPEDVAIVGFDDTAAAVSAAIPLTSVAHQVEQTGQAAFNLLMAAIEARNKPDQPQHPVTIRPELVVRISSVASP